jgi:NTP pyrophosphatase (non-canonical NTP hydrolase)
MNLNEYQKLCKKTAKKDFKTADEEIMCWGLGLCGEAGDVASCIKKTFAQNKDTKEGIKENLGDMLWYSAMICNFFRWDMQKILEENIEKLKNRFPGGFNYDAVQRDMIKWGGFEDDIKTEGKNG